MTNDIRMVAATDIGKVRMNNEDSLRIIPNLGLAIVADGMGGHQSGDIASRMAIDTLSRFLEENARYFSITNDAPYVVDGTSMNDGFSLSNQEIYTSSQSIEVCKGMGTTLVAGAFSEGRLLIGHVGDSRLYRYRQQQLEQLTEDHTLSTEMLKENPNAELPAYASHVLRRAMGIEIACRPDIIETDTQKGDIYLLCSDGLCGMVSDNDIKTLITLYNEKPESCIRRLVESALNQGGSDNISAVLVYT